MKALVIALAVLGTVLAMPVLAAATVAISWVVLPSVVTWFSVKAWRHHTSPQQRTRR